MRHRFEVFLRLYGLLRERVPDPAELAAAAEDPRVAALAADLALAAARLHQGLGRVEAVELAAIPADSRKALADFASRYREPLARLVAGGVAAAEGRLARVPPQEGAAAAAPNPASLVADLLFAVEDMAGEHLAHRLGETLDAGLAAWRHFEQETGFDFYGAARRERLVPRAAAALPQPFEALLSEARRAFVLGCPAAAASLARSIMELALTRLYDIAEDDLETMIDTLERRHAWTARLKLNSRRRYAAAVLDNAARQERDSERALAEFLVAVGELVART